MGAGLTRFRHPETWFLGQVLVHPETGFLNQVSVRIPRPSQKPGFYPAETRFLDPGWLFYAK